MNDVIAEVTNYSEGKNPRVQCISCTILPGLSLHNFPSSVFTLLLIISHENSYPCRVNTFGRFVNT